MSHLLLEILADEVMKGNKPSNAFKASSFSRVAKEISEKFGVDCHPKHVDNHLRTVKSTWNTIVKIRDNTTDFGWDDDLKIITCSKDMYNQEVQAFPNHEPFLNKRIEMYDEMALVVGKDVGTGRFAKSLVEIQVEDNLVGGEPLELDVDGENMSNGRQSASNSASSKPRPRRKRNRATAELESNYVMLAEKMENIANAIKEINNFAYIDELYDEVMKMRGFDEVMLASAFDHLVGNHTTARAFIKKSVKLRRIWLENFFMQHSKK